MPECPHPGAVEHIHAISVPLNRATLVLCLLLHESSTFATVLRTSSKLHVGRRHGTADNFEIFRVFRIIMAIMVKWRGSLLRGRAEDGKL